MDDPEFDAFYAATARGLIGQVYALTGSMTEAEDCVQEAYARAWARRRQLEATENPTAWVRTVACRLAISRWRRARNALFAWQARSRQEREPAGPTPDRVALTHALRQLPDVQRQAVVLHHLCDLPVQQISAMTGTPTGTVKARLARGRARLAQLLADPTDPTDPTDSAGSAVNSRIREESDV